MSFRQTRTEAEDEAVLGGVGLNTIIASMQRRLWRARTRMRVEPAYIYIEGPAESRSELRPERRSSSCSSTREVVSSPVEV
jgi:hypothetical protein